MSRLAAGQGGMLTAAQAERQDITRSQLTRLTDAGVLDRVERGVYATTSSADQNRGLRAAWLALDPAQTAEERLANPMGAGVISHTSAAGLHKLGDLLDDVPEITYPYRKQTRRGIRLHRADLAEADVTLVDGLPTTTEERTVADLLRDGHDPEHIAQIIEQGVRRGVIDPPDLAEHLEPLSRRYGQPDGQSLVAHLLDLVGLSPAAVMRDLAKSNAGQELLAAGRATALIEALAPLLQTLDLSRITGMQEMTKTIERNLANPAAAQIAQMAKTLSLPRAASTGLSPLAETSAESESEGKGSAPTAALAQTLTDEGEGKP